MKKCTNCRFYEPKNELWTCSKQIWIADLNQYWCTQYEPGKKYFNKMNNYVLGGKS
jgi:hypothetical protein